MVIQFTIVLPKEKYNWFYEIARPLQQEWNINDIIIDTFENLLHYSYDDEIIYILLGCDCLSYFPAKKYIVYQFEQLYAKTDVKYKPALEIYKQLLSNAILTMEYSYANIDVLKKLEIRNVIYSPFGYSKCMEYNFGNLTYDDKSNDILWLGCTLGRRIDIINMLKKNFGNFFFYSNNIFDNDKFIWIKKSKIAINIHMEEPQTSCLEVVRILYYVANKCLVVSEPSGDVFTDNLFKNIVIFSSKDMLIDTITYLIQNPEIIKNRIEYSYEYVKNHCLFREGLRMAKNKIYVTLE